VPGERQARAVLPARGREGPAMTDPAVPPGGTLGPADDTVAGNGARAGGGGASAEPLLRTEGLTKVFKIGRAMWRKLALHAVDDVAVAIREREIVALAGESGSGKSTIARLLAKLYKPTAGEIYFQGTPLSQIRSRRQVLRYRGDVPMVFQDPF